MCHPFKSIALLVMLAAVDMPGAYAQKAANTLTGDEVKHIQSDAGSKLSELAELLNYLADNKPESSELDFALNPKFDPPDNMFYSREFFMDDDTYPDHNKSGIEIQKMEPYLRSFHYRYFPRKESSISIRITQFTPVYINGSNPYLLVKYQQTFDGTDDKGRKFSPVSKVANMIVLKTANGRYRTCISGLSFIDKAPSWIAGSKEMEITGEAGETVPDIAQKSPEYYRNMLARGRIALRNGSYPDAYYAFMEARQQQSLADEANKLQLQLDSIMNIQSIDVNDYMSDSLAKKADELSRKYRYDEAIRHYKYASDAKLSNSNLIAPKLQAVTQRKDNDQRIWALYDKGAYPEAIREFTAAIKKDKNNPNLYIGLAQSYAQSGQDDSAFNNFQKAINTDPQYAETYKRLGFYYKQKKSYKAANAQFAKYQTSAEDGAESDVQSAIAYCAGMLLIAEGNASTGMDSINAALRYNPGNKEALAAQADLYRNQGNYKAARKSIEEALQKDGKFAEAYNMKGHILEEGPRPDKNEVIEAYKTATELVKDNARYFYDLGKAQMDNPDDDYSAAIGNFTSCINTVPATGYRNQAYWKRGKCYYLQNKYQEAEDDYRKYQASAVVKVAAFYADFINALKRNNHSAEAQQYLMKAK